MKTTIKQRLAVLFALITILTLVGCNTMEGFGRDVEQTGEEIQEGAN